MTYTRKQINEFRASIKPGDALIIRQRGWWRGDGADPDMYQTVVSVKSGLIETEGPHGRNGFTFRAPAKVGDVLELTENSMTYVAGPNRYEWEFEVDR